MKFQTFPPATRANIRISIFTVILSIIFPLSILGQDKDIEPIVECVEYIGNETYLATFGYDNPNNQEIAVADTSSNVITNYGQTKEKAVNTFKPGRQRNVFTKEFKFDDHCIWRVKLPNGAIKETHASINSSHCDEGTIESKYPFPRNGKESNSKIGADLTALYNFYKAGNEVYSDELFQIKDGSKVLVEIDSDKIFDFSDNYPPSNVIFFDNERIILYFPILELLNLNKNKSVNYVLPIYTPVTNGFSYSQGDTAILANWARQAFQLDGSGIKVGVISDSYNNPLAGNTDYEPLEDVDVLLDYPYGTNEGRAMLEIIDDVAPGSDLAFRTGFLGPQDMVNGIDSLVDHGCDIIVDDVTYITEPFFTDGIVAQKVNDVVFNDSIVYFTSAGNFADKSYQSIFKPAGDKISGINAVFHDFENNDIYQKVDLATGDYTIVLQWDGGIPTSTDLDIYVTDEFYANPIGFNRDNEGGEPVEVLSFSVSSLKPANISIAKTSGQDVNFKFIVFKGGISILEYDSKSSTIVGHANAEKALTIGAVNFTNTPEYGEPKPIVEPYSSIGGMFVNGLDRAKPDFCAPDNIQTSVLNPFRGTSAAAPHAAALAALVMQAKQKFYQEKITYTLTKQILGDNSIDMYGAGPDSASGFGLIQADSAILSFANPIPQLDCLEDLKAVAEDTFSVVLSGNYFIDSSIVYFDGMSVPTAFNSNSQLTALIPTPYDEEIYYELTVWNPPKSEGGLDGGFSNGMTFEHPCKIKVIVEILDDTIKYGQPIPDPLLADISLEINDSTSFNLEQAYLNEIIDSTEYERIKAITIVTTAQQLSDVGNYLIKVDGNDPLVNAVNTTLDPLDAEMLEKYIFEVHQGVLTVEKMGLKIIPEDQKITYGDIVSGVSYQYHFEDQSVSDTLLSLIDTTYENALFDTVPQIKINTQENLDSALQNKSFLTSASASSYFANNVVEFDVINNGKAFALVNGIAYALVNGQAFALVNGTAFALVNGQAFALVNGKAFALVNGKAFALVNGEAYALVNGKAFALVNGNLYSLEDGEQLENQQDTLSLTNGEAFALVNGQAFALVNGVAVALVNGKAFALVNATELTNHLLDQYQDYIDENSYVILNDVDTTILYDDGGGHVTLQPVTVVTGNSVGTHHILPGTFMSTNFDVSYEPGNLIVNPDTLTISAELFETNGIYDVRFSFEGFIDGEGPEVLDTLSYEMSMSSYENAGSYEVCPVAVAENYYIIKVCNEYANPSGPGTKKLRSYLYCIEDIGDGEYIAHFGWENDNSIPVFVPAGENNNLLPDSAVDFTRGGLPEFFPPGSGEFDIYYDGSNITWTISSYESDHKSSTTTGVSADSPKCLKSAELSADFSGDNLIEKDINIYPNPTNGIVTISLSEEPAMNLVNMYDVWGRKLLIEKTWISSSGLELDFRNEPPGIYILSLELDSEVLNFRIIKQ